MHRDYADAPRVLRDAVERRICFVMSLRLHHAAKAQHLANERAAVAAAADAPLAAAVVCELSRVEMKATALLVWDAARVYAEALRRLAAARAKAAAELRPFWVPPWERGDAREEVAERAENKPPACVVEHRAILYVWSRSYRVARETSRENRET
jgi:fermentation-respiration switch protein FrsA (DUF1100 family)